MDLIKDLKDVMKWKGISAEAIKTSQKPMK